MMNAEIGALTHSLLSVGLFSVIGMGILAVSFLVMDRLTPGNLWKEVVEEKNVALAIVTAAMTLAMAIIISAAISN